MTLQDQAHQLFEDQIISWPLLGAHWNRLEEARVRDLRFEGFEIRIQCNPKRIVSSAAKVDKASIEKRACFLCRENRPAEEKHVSISLDYEILCNPFPIFREHFTIAKTAHVPQAIETEFEAFLEISRELPDLAVFYNAPNCGASAPDHMHFQAGNRGFMPIEHEIGTLKERYGKLLLSDETCTVHGIDDGLRRFYVLESGSPERLSTLAGAVFSYLRSLQGGDPMINMLSYFDQGWMLLLFPRDLHRPWQYFEEGEDNILLSPASVDMGGSLITPLEKDFHKLTRADVVDIFQQLTFSKANFQELNRFIKEKDHE